MSEARRSPGYYATAVVASAAVTGAAFFAGYMLALRPLKRHVEKHAVSTMGPLVEADERRALAAAYHDAERAASELDAYTWDVDKVPAPFVGYGPAPGEHPSATIDAHMLRSTRELEVPKPDGTVRIFLTGGSTAFGVGAPDDERTVAGYLERTLSRELSAGSGLTYEVFTAAAPAWASTHERILIENRLSELEPDLVVSLSGANDVHWALRGRDVLWFRAYADDYFRSALDLVLHAVGEDPLGEVIEIEGGPVDPRFVGYRLEKNVRMSAYVLATYGVTYVFALQPVLPVTRQAIDPSSAEAEDGYFLACYEAIRERLGAFDLPNFRFVDLSRSLDTVEGRSRVYLDSYHFGDRGNEILADLIFRSTEDLLRGLGE